MKTKFYISLLASAALLPACQSDSKNPSVSQTTVQDEPVVAMNAPSSVAKSASMEDISLSGNNYVEDLGEAPIKQVVSKKKLIKDGNLSLKTAELQACKIKIDQMIKQANAYYESEDLQNNDQMTSYNLKIRIPAENFETLIGNIEKGEDEITSKNIQSRDVTEEYVDIETRLNNKRAYLGRYRELLNKASNVSDVIAIEESIRNLQEEIESKEGHLKYMNDQIAYSTLYLTLVKEKAFVYKPGPKDQFSERVKKSLSNGWSSIVDGCLWVISMWPALLFILIAFLALRRYRRRKQ